MSLDKITRSLLDQFVQREQLEGLKEDDAFERFVNYCVISNEYSDTFDVEEVSSSDTEYGIDGIAVIVNGTLITDVSEVAGAAEQNKYLDATFVFAQAKRSDGFSASAVTSMGHAIQEFFSDSPTVPDTDFIRRYREIADEIYSNSPRFKNRRPICRIFYATTGRWTEDPVVSAAMRDVERRLRESDQFETVEFVALGAKELQSLYYRTQNPVAVEFTFPRKQPLPSIAGVESAYIGVLAAADFLKLIVDEAGQLQRSLFVDNVRDYQGDNPVNQKIGETLSSGERERFAILNNGVAIVARELRTSGEKVYMKDYQVVNGGQTSHVVFLHRAELKEGVFIPIKLIGATDEDLTTAVITATNSQTAIRTDELNARSEFERSVEQYFNAVRGDSQRLFYERRSKQYNDDASVVGVRIITRAILVRSYASMFLDEPHRAVGYVPQLLTQMGSQLFRDSDRLAPYYASAFAYYKLESLFRNRQVDSSYKPARWHILMVARHLAVGRDVAPANSKTVEKQADGMTQVLWDDAKALELFKEAVSVVERALPSLARDAMRSLQATTDVLTELHGTSATASQGESQ